MQKLLWLIPQALLVSATTTAAGSLSCVPEEDDDASSAPESSLPDDENSDEKSESDKDDKSPTPGSGKDESSKDSPEAESPSPDPDPEASKEEGSDAGSDEDGESGDTSPLPMPETKAQLCEQLAKQPRAKVSGPQVVTWWEDFVKRFAGRRINQDNNVPSAQYLLGELDELGYETELLELTHKGRTVRVVQGIMPGSEKPDEYTVIGAHYDHVKATPSGAYDNASGVATVRSICTNLAKANLKRSHACLFFDAEEEGLWGSAAWVKAFVKGSTKTIKVAQMFNFDMAGINWPGKEQWPLYGTIGLPKSERDRLLEPHATTIETVLYECVNKELDIDPKGVKILRKYDKSSDEISFMRNGVPTIRFFGGRHASDYPYYHKSGDTVKGVYEIAGGRESFEMGIEMAIKSAYYTILAFDLLDPQTSKVLQ